MTLAMIGTTVAQLFTINHHDSGFGYTAVGRPLAAACFAIAIGTLLMGAVRTWRYQNAMIRGRALVSGFEIHVIGISVSLVSSLPLPLVVKNRIDVCSFFWSSLAFYSRLIYSRQTFQSPAQKIEG